MKNIYIKGSDSFPECVIKTLLGMNGLNVEGFTGDLEDHIYFVDPVTKSISRENINSLIGKLIQESNEWEEMIISPSREDFRDKCFEKYPIRYTGFDKTSYNEGYDHGFEKGYEAGWKDADEHPSPNNGWISPRIKLPEEYEECLFYTNCRELCFGMYSDGTWNDIDCGVYYSEEILFWFKIILPTKK